MINYILRFLVCIAIFAGVTQIFNFIVPNTVIKIAQENGIVYGAIVIIVSLIIAYRRK